MLAARIVAAVIALGACLALPVSAGAESPQATIRTFELRIEQRRVPPAQRVLRATEGERVELRWSSDDNQSADELSAARFRHVMILGRARRARRWPWTLPRLS